MLLRSSSTPILNSWLTHNKDSCTEAEPAFHILRRTRSSVYYTSSFVFISPLWNDDDPLTKKAHYVLSSEAELYSPTKPMKKTSLPHCSHRKQLKVIKCNEVNYLRINERLVQFSNSGLGERVQMDREESDVGSKERVLQTLVEVGGGGNGGNNGKGSDGGGYINGGWGNHGSDSTDVYYLNMIEANPGNPLFLGNYAKFLKEVKYSINQVGSTNISN